jgi:hypothetical protein
VYLKLGRHGPALASSADPHIVVRLPKHEKKTAETAAAKQSKVRKAVPAKDGAWLSAKPKAKRKKAAPKAKATKKVKTKAASKKPAAAKRNSKGTTTKTAASKPVTENEIIEIASDDDDDDIGEATELPLKRQRSTEETLWSDPDSSEDEFEFLD